MHCLIKDVTDWMNRILFSHSIELRRVRRGVLTLAAVTRTVEVFFSAFNLPLQRYTIGASPSRFNFLETRTEIRSTVNNFFQASEMR